MVFLQNKENLLFALFLFQTISPCGIKNQNLWRPIGQSLYDLEKQTDPEVVAQQRGEVREQF